MEFADVDNVKEQIPVLIGNLNNRGSLSAFDVVQQVKLTLPAAILVVYSSAASSIINISSMKANRISILSFE